MEVSRSPLPGVLICPTETGCYACLRYRVVETSPDGQSRERIVDGEPIYSCAAKMPKGKALTAIVLGADLAFGIGAQIARELTGAIEARDRLIPQRRLDSAAGAP